MCSVFKSCVAVGTLFALSLMVAPCAKAALISIELDDVAGTAYSGVESAAAAANSAFAAADVWNRVTAASWPVYTTSVSVSSLLDSTGASTSVGFAITAGSAEGWEGWTTNPSYAGQDDLRGGNFSLYTGSGRTASEYLDWSLTGLSAGKPCTLYFYAGGAPDAETPFTLLIDTNGDGLLTDETGVTVAGDGQLATAVSSATGVILGQVIRPAGVNDAAWSGLQISWTDGEVPPVPEPSAVVLLAAGLAGLVMGIRRTRQK